MKAVVYGPDTTCVKLPYHLSFSPWGAPHQISTQCQIFNNQNLGIFPLICFKPFESHTILYTVDDIKYKTKANSIILCQKVEMYVKTYRLVSL